MSPFSRLLDALSKIPDPRRRQGRRYELPYLLLFSVLAILSGATGYSDIVVFIEVRLDTLNSLFGSRFRRAPSINTIRVPLKILGPEYLEAALRGYSEDLVTAKNDTAMPVIALDGKTLRGSFDRFNERKAAHTLSAFAIAEGITLAHFEVDGKTNEIPCVQALIRELALPGVLYTADGMHCQKGTFEAAAETGSHVLVQVKENQPTLLADMQQIAATLPPSGHCEIVDKVAHGRQERRLVESFDIRALPSATLGKEWNGLIETVMRVTRLTWCKNAETGLWAPREDASYYACQTHLSAAAAAAAIRGHWNIESHHYVRDVTLCEDASRIRIAPLNFARLRSIALNILRGNGIQNVARALFRNALDIENILSYQLS